MLSNTVLPEPLGASKAPLSGSFGTMSCLDCLHVCACSLMGVISFSSFKYYNIDIKLNYLTNNNTYIYIYMSVIDLAIILSLILSVSIILSFICYYLV